LWEVAKRFERPPGAPKPSDICFSSRWPRPLNAKDPHDAFKAAKAFHATRFDWNYPRNAAFIRKVKAAGYGYYGAISSELDGSTGRTGRDKDHTGRIIGNPELASLAARGDVCSDEYYRIVMVHLKRIVDGGADGVQVDDPGMTYHNAVHLGGGYGDASLRAFRAFLAERTTAAERTAWRMPNDLDGFDYAAYVRARDGEPPPAVRSLFLAFHRSALDAFYRRVRDEIDGHAKRHVPFSCNNWSIQDQTTFPFREHFDYWVGETSVRYGNPTAKRIYEKVKNAEALGKVQVFSPPNDGPDKIPTRKQYVALTRRLIATSYACGSATLVPWDVWRRGPKTPRFFGTAEEFGDLFDLIAAHPELYNDHEEVFAVGPDIAPRRAAGLTTSPVTIATDAGTVFAAVRAVPKAPTAPIVVHLVDWADQPSALRIDLDNEAFGGTNDKAMSVRLLLPGRPPRDVTGTLGANRTTRFDIPALRPYGVLAVLP